MAAEVRRAGGKRCRDDDGGADVVGVTMLSSDGSDDGAGGYAADRGGANRPLNGEAPSSHSTALYAARVFLCASSHVVHYLHNVMPEEDLSLLAEILSLSAIKKEFLIRLACRRSPWHVAVLLEEEYAAWETQFNNDGRVRDVICDLRAGPSPFILVRSGGDFISTSSNDNREGPSELAVTVLHTLRVSDLQELARSVLDAVSFPLRSAERKGARGGIPKTKAALIAYLTANITACAAAWDQQLGDVVSVAPRIRALVSRLFDLFQVVVPDVGEMSNNSTPGQIVAPVPPAVPPRIVLSVLRVTRLPMVKILPRFLGGRSPVADGAPTPLPLCIFQTAESFRLYVEAVAMESRLFTLTLGTSSTIADAKGDINRAAAIVRDGIDRCLEVRRREQAERLQLMMMVDGEEDEEQPSRKTDRYLPQLFESQPQRYCHLMRFTPLYRWLSCAELLVQLFERGKNYSAAVRWIDDVLLPTSMTATASASEDRPQWVYRARHRGFFYYRLVVGLLHLNRPAEALSRGDEFLSMLAHNECNEEGTVPLCEQLAWYCRRADRIALERTVARLWTAPRRWTAPPSGMLIHRLREAPHIMIHAAREPKTGLWMRRAASSSWIDGYKGSSSVEGCALRWYIGGRGRKEAGWSGVHCEGSWAASLFGLLFYDDLYSCEHIQDLVYLSPFQPQPSDLTIPGAFYRRRRTSIDTRLAMLEGLSRKGFIELVDSALTKVAPVATDAENDNGDDEEGGGDGVNHRGEFVFGLNAALPLREIAAAVPIRPLVALFRSLLCTPVSMGFGIRFSGFPDLCLWRSAAPPSYCSAFLLSEVKSPSDRLSDKQLCVIDQLLRCGFEVDIAHVVDGDTQLPRCCSSRSTTAQRLHSEILSD